MDGCSPALRISRAGIRLTIHRALPYIVLQSQELKQIIHALSDLIVKQILVDIFDLVSFAWDRLLVIFHWNVRSACFARELPPWKFRLPVEVSV